MDDAFYKLLKLTEPQKNEEHSLDTGNPIGRGVNMIEEDSLVTPEIKSVKNSNTDRPTIFVLDDDFPTLDIMKIYLQRDYEYVSFDNPKDAIFWLNTRIPDLIFIDCYLTHIKSKRVIEIIRSNPAISKVPIFYICEPDEEGPITAKLPEGVYGVISRPVHRGHLQDILDYVFKINKDQFHVEG